MYYSQVPNEVSRLAVVADDHLLAAPGAARLVLDPAAADLGRRAPHHLRVVARHRPCARSADRIQRREEAVK